ncbi:MAG: hypothetical protein HQ530_05835 [Parcubacteria group bacterium]|nr:hypothetical protein [Parcubacteria group bacterium]
MRKLSASPAGFLQAISITAYCVLVSGLFWVLEEFFQQPPQFIAVALMLIIFVFSAAVTGTLFFGYPAYLALHQETKKALAVIAHTMLYSLGIIIITLVVISVVSELVG